MAFPFVCLIVTRVTVSKQMTFAEFIFTLPRDLARLRRKRRENICNQYFPGLLCRREYENIAIFDQ